MSTLIVDVPCKQPQVMFALEKNTVYSIYKSKEETRTTWYTKADKDRFKMISSRDALFFRQLRTSNQEIDSYLYEDHFCHWGLENIISRNTAIKVTEIKTLVRNSVFLMQAINDQKGETCEIMNRSTTLRDLNKFSQQRAYKIGVYHEKRARQVQENAKKSLLRDKHKSRSLASLDDNCGPACLTEPGPFFC